MPASMAAPSSRNPVTVVVPAYGDIESLIRCLDSVLATVDLGVDELLVINDCGPEVDAVEAAVLARLEGTPARYERNPQNLGFPKTCNRAARLAAAGNDILLLNSDAELTAGALDELAAVLHLDEKHGAVFPRSNNATIGTIPTNPWSDAAHEPEASRLAWERLRPELPRYTLTPVAVGFCLLIRRRLIDDYGLFDEIFSPGYEEENDFCLRVNRYGYSSVLAHQAFVVHGGSKSFTDARRTALQARNTRIIEQRYPYFSAAAHHYRSEDIDPIDWYGDRLAGDGPRRILIDARGMPVTYNGSARTILEFLEALAAQRESIDADIHIAVQPDAAERFDLDRLGLELRLDEHLSDLYDLGYALAPIYTAGRMLEFDRHCLRWAVAHLDVIALRLLELRESDPTRRQVVLDSLNHADRVLAISRDAVRDTKAYYGPALDASFDERVSVVHLGLTSVAGRRQESFEGLDAAQRAVVEAGGYVFVIGNHFSHKQLPEAVAALVGGSRPVVVLGRMPGGAGGAGGATVIAGGGISDDVVATLYRRAACFVFPSNYEGYGLPIVEAADAGVPIVLFDTAVAREVADSIGLDRVVRIDSFAQLPAAVEAAIELGPQRPADLPTIRQQYEHELIPTLLAELDRPVDLDRLRARFRYFHALAAYRQELEVLAGRALQQLRDSRLRARVFRRLGPLQPLARSVWSRVHRS